MANLTDDPFTDLKIQKVKKGRRYKYLKRPKGAGPSVGWVSWIHGRTQEYNNFEKWLFRGKGDDPGSHQIEDNLAIDCTREISNGVRATLAARGEMVKDPDTGRWEKIKASWSRSSREVLQKKIDDFIPMPSYHWVALDNEYGMIWDAGSFRIIHRLANGKCWCSFSYYDRALALQRFRLKRIAWERSIDLSEWIRSGT